eukprot:scaffold133427_cov112-Phaeocystis_antarctica.AAC.1
MHRPSRSQATRRPRPSLRRGEQQSLTAARYKRWSFARRVGSLRTPESKCQIGTLLQRFEGRPLTREEQFALRHDFELSDARNNPFHPSDRLTQPLAATLTPGGTYSMLDRRPS